MPLVFSLDLERNFGFFLGLLVEMNDFIHSCNAAATYPKNLISHGVYLHTLQSYVDRLDSREGNLFGSENNASLDFWDLDDGAASARFSGAFRGGRADGC